MLALFPAEFVPWPPRSTIERFYNVQRWMRMAAGGHFAALEEPGLLFKDLPQFGGVCAADRRKYVDRTLPARLYY
jgi:hypothetical protein